MAGVPVAREESVDRVRESRVLAAEAAKVS